MISSINQESLYLDVGAEDFLVKALVDNTDDKIKGPIIHPSKVIFGSTVGREGTPVTSCICKSRRVLLLSSGEIHKISMLYGALKNQPKQKSGRAIALPAPAPPRSLSLPALGLA